MRSRICELDHAYVELKSFITNNFELDSFDTILKSFKDFRRPEFINSIKKM